MRLKVLAQGAVFVLLSTGVAFAGGKAYTCDDCSDECLENPYGKGCPSVCKDPACQASQASCDDCSDECKMNPYSPGCPDICKDISCQSCEDCTPECKMNPYGEGCPDICRDIKCYSCDDCSVECIENPEGENCPPVCDELGCNICDKFPTDCPESCVDDTKDQEGCPAECQGVPAECLPTDVVDDTDTDEIEDTEADLAIGPLRFVGDLGYLRLSDPADYLFARLGVQYSPFAGTSLENLSFLAMVGAAPKLDGSDGDDALLIDVFAQYNWSGAFDGFVGLGLGGWITDNDSDLDSDDSDLDVLANIGARVYGDPNAFNISVFLEARSAVDEMSDIDQYGRFGIGLRFQH
ncbi:MAG: hypothetical protein Q3M24_14455 [Candidatus Electrothrix aestuarii]|uniref:Outer membrane protein beta-barrel domain-containing protein n=1 Tax=Candidatus Electrothrix aestuarii TaxID=3062594 RepID=A0AAU8LR65_9BACT|nr:hypothetical protein [Candidatus Electrothrix aestuarii]